MKSSALFTAATLLFVPVQAKAQTTPIPTQPAPIQVCTTSHADMDAARRSIRALPAIDGKLHIQIEGKETVLTLEQATDRARHLVVQSRQPTLSSVECGATAAMIEEIKIGAQGFGATLPVPAPYLEGRLALKRGVPAVTQQTIWAEKARFNNLDREILKARPPILPPITQCQTTVKAINAAQSAIKFQTMVGDRMSILLGGNTVVLDVHQATAAARAAVIELGQTGLDPLKCAKDKLLVDAIAIGVRGIVSVIRAAGAEMVGRMQQEKSAALREANKDCEVMPKNDMERWRSRKACNDKMVDVFTRFAGKEMRLPLASVESYLQTLRIENIIRKVRPPRIVANPE